jgi:hypothetical protein
MDGIDGAAAGDPMTGEQMRALFGCGLHPLAELRQQQLEGPDLTSQDFRNAARLGRRSRSSTTICARFGSRWRARRGAQHGNRMAGRTKIKNVDEMNLLIVPLVVGQGTRLFPATGVPESLERHPRGGVGSGQSCS